MQRRGAPRFKTTTTRASFHLAVTKHVISRRPPSHPDGQQTKALGGGQRDADIYIYIVQWLVLSFRPSNKFSNIGRQSTAGNKQGSGLGWTECPGDSSCLPECDVRTCLVLQWRASAPGPNPNNNNCFAARAISSKGPALGALGLLPHDRTLQTNHITGPGCDLGPRRGGARCRNKTDSARPQACARHHAVRMLTLWQTRT